ncbi:MAG: 30S ribosomal protein S4 [Candidatus Paceibacterota bacterium]
MDTQKCKICRKTGTKLFIKGARCYSAKCAMTRRPNPPGPLSKRGYSITDFGREFAEKQKMKAWYGLREKQFKNYVNEVLGKLSNSKVKADDALVRKLEMRLDSTIFRLGFATSLRQARKMVSQGHFKVNGKKVDVASYQCRKGDKIIVSDKSKKNGYFQKLAIEIKKYKAPSWVKINFDTLEGEVVGLPTAEEVALPVSTSAIFEHYSK